MTKHADCPACRNSVAIALADEVWRALERVLDTLVDDDADEVTKHAALESVKRILCKYAATRPQEDHGGTPEHDYCWRCGGQTPGQAPRKVGRVSSECGGSNA